MTKKPWTDRRVEDVVGRLLQGGVIVAAAVVLLGAIVFLAGHGMEHANYRVFAGEPSDLRTMHGIVRRSLVFGGKGIVQLGLLLLIVTPIARVAFSIFGFAEEKDWMYVAFTVFVLAVLLYSLIGSA